jgi:hypothetical protein
MRERAEVVHLRVDARIGSERVLEPIVERLLEQLDIEDDDMAVIAAALSQAYVAGAHAVAIQQTALLIEHGLDVRLELNE